MFIRGVFTYFFLCFENGFVVAFTTPCPQGWLMYNDHCYKVSLNLATYETAQELCQIYEGYLATIHSHEENNFIFHLTSGPTDDTFWFGLQNKNDLQTWIDGSILNWAVWTSQTSFDQPCGLMVRGSYWTTDYCEYSHQFICKQPVKRDTTTQIQSTTEKTTTQPRTTTTTHVPTTTETTAASSTEIVTQITEITTVTTTSMQTTTTTAFVQRVESSSPDPFTTKTTTTQGPRQTDPAKQRLGTTPLTTTEMQIVVPEDNPNKTVFDFSLRAVGIGSIGILFILGTICGIIILDIQALRRDFKMLISNCKQCWERFDGADDKTREIKKPDNKDDKRRTGRCERTADEKV